jgi:peroxiredoxin
MFCHRQVSQLRYRIKDFDAVDAQVFLIEAHEPSRILETMKEASIEPGEVGVPILADTASTVAAAYGVAFQMSVHVELANRPGAFIIDRDGILRFAYRGATYSDRYYADDLLEELAVIRSGR